MLSTNDITELEKKYSKYIFKKRLKLTFIVTIFLSIIVFALYYLFYSPKNQKKTVDTNKSAKNVIKKTINMTKPKDTNFTKAKTIKPIDTNFTRTAKIVKVKKENNLTLNIAKKKNNISNMTEEVIKPDANISNSNNIEKKLIFHIKPQNSAATNTKSTGILRLNRYFLDKKYNTKKQKNIKTVKNINKNDTIQKEKYAKPKIHIEMRDIDSTQYLKKKFQKTHDIVFALMLCENYYSKKNYRESLKWSIIANDIDSQSEKSWMWFAKSKYRLNQRNDAIKALKAFLKSKESKSIRMLLKDITNGELND